MNNKNHVEGSICEAFITEEIATFCSHYFEPEIETRLNRADRNDEGSEDEAMGRLSVFTQTGRKLGRARAWRYLTETEYKAACNYVLFNCVEITPFLE